jgi:xanthine dehydrogenase YagT iron-sulfur-binding subunit
MSTTPQGVPITLTLNGQRRDVTVDPWVTLLDLVREQFDLTGSKKGCDHGQCGACTMIVDGKRMNSCLLLAVARDGSEITTIEGLGQPGHLHAVQDAFVEHDAYQCGYCTPGQICSAVALLEHGDARTGPPALSSRAEIRELMSGNLCRCGAYTNIVDAIEDVLGRGDSAQDGRSQEKVEKIEVTA